MSFTDKMKPSYNADLHDIHIAAAANNSAAIWATSLRSIATPSVRLAGKLELNPDVDAGSRIQHLLAFGIITTLGSVTFTQLQRIRERNARIKARVHIRASDTLIDAIEGRRQFNIPDLHRETLLKVLSQFDLSFEPIPFDPQQRDYITSQLNRFGNRLLNYGSYGQIVTDPQYRPQAGSLVDFNKPRVMVHRESATLEPLTLSGYFQQ
jgi:hypothetical protein